MDTARLSEGGPVVFGDILHLPDPVIQVIHGWSDLWQQPVIPGPFRRVNQWCISGGGSVIFLPFRCWLRLLATTRKFFSHFWCVPLHSCFAPPNPQTPILNHDTNTKTCCVLIGGLWGCFHRSRETNPGFLAAFAAVNPPTTPGSLKRCANSIL